MRFRLCFPLIAGDAHGDPTKTYATKTTQQTYPTTTTQQTYPTTTTEQTHPATTTEQTYPTTTTQQTYPTTTQTTTQTYPTTGPPATQPPVDPSCPQLKMDGLNDVFLPPRAFFCLRVRLRIFFMAVKKGACACNTREISSDVTMAALTRGLRSPWYFGANCFEAARNIGSHAKSHIYSTRRVIY